MKRGRKQSRCTDCKKKKRRCTPDHLIEELPGEGESKDEECEAEWKDDPLAPIRRLALPGLGVLGSETNLPGVDTKMYDFLTSHQSSSISITCCFSFCFRKQSEQRQRHSRKEKILHSRKEKMLPVPRRKSPSYLPSRMDWTLR